MLLRFKGKVFKRKKNTKLPKYIMLLRTTIFIPFVAVFPRKSQRSRKLKEAVFEWYSSDAVGCDAKYTCFRGHSKSS